jgi:hypothetical protein
MVEGPVTSLLNEASCNSCVLDPSSLLPAAVHFVDVLQAQQTQLAERGATLLGRIKAESLGSGGCLAVGECAAEETREMATLLFD